jgi:hypothetical protein
MQSGLEKYAYFLKEVCIFFYGSSGKCVETARAVSTHLPDEP